MRADIPSYELIEEKSLTATLARLAREPGAWQPFAGGTDLMVVLEAGALEHRRFLNVWHLDELRGVRATKQEFSIGALTTFSEIRAHPGLSRHLPMLGLAAAETGAIAIQNRGTIGGNIANASPAADTPPALLAYDAELELLSSAGARRVAYGAFHLGYKKTALRPGELISRVFLKRPAPGLRHYYRKVGTRKAQAISKVCFAGTLRISAGRIQASRVAVGSMAATPVRCHLVEAALQGQELRDAAPAARAALEREPRPIDDIRSTGAYRLTVAGNLLEEFLLL